MMGQHTDPSLLSTPLLWGGRGLECEEGWGLGRQFRWRAIPAVSSRPPGAPTREPVPPGQSVAVRGVCLQRVSAQLPLTCPLFLCRGLIHLLTHVAEALHQARLLAFLVIPPAVAPG